LIKLLLALTTLAAVYPVSAYTASVPQAAAGSVAPDTIEARAQGCSTCHGARGEGTSDPGFPRIAGKPAGYLFNQLKHFRDGERSYPPMNYLVAYMHDDYLAELAQYFAAQSMDPGTARTPPPPTRPPANDDSGASRLVNHGDPAHGVPACVLCHGPRLTGIEPGIPGLTGLDSRYIAAQLVSWRVGMRHASNPDCMRDIASRLSEAQVRQVAAWLGAQRAAGLPSPAPAGSWTTPLPCGSQP
jgi:cytochrome c553